MPFNPEQWEGAEVLDEEMVRLERLHDNALSLEERKVVLVELLDAASPAARGLAFDFYSLTCANLRHGDNPMIDPSINATFHTAALRELANAPSEAGESGRRPRPGANHVSALNALRFTAVAADAEPIARVLGEEADEHVLEFGLWPAVHALRDAPAHAGLVSALLRIVRRPDLAPRTRDDAFLAIAGATGDTVEPILTEALSDPVLEISAAAARALLDRDPRRHRSAVAAAAASWPTEAGLPYSVEEVRRLLASPAGPDDSSDEDELMR